MLTLKRFVMKSLILLFLLFIPLCLFSQAIKITEHGARNVVENLEIYPIEIVEVKTLKKWKALTQP